MPPIRAQKDLRRFAALLPAFNLDGGVVTGAFRLAPLALYASRPFCVNPPVELLCPLASTAYSTRYSLNVNRLYSLSCGF